MLKVRDIMTRKVLTLDPEADVREAARGLDREGVSGAPVRDDAGNLVGVLSKSDLTRPPRRVEPRPPKVSDTMTPVLFSARATDPVSFAVRRMVETGSHRLIVVGDDGDLVGIVTPMDVMRALLDGRLDPDDFTESVGS